MELKTLFYIAIGIIWLISKFLEANKNAAKADKRPSGPIVVPAKKIPQPSKVIKKQPVSRIPKEQNQPVVVPGSVEKVEKADKVVNYENYFLKRKPLFSEETVMQGVQILDHGEDHRNSIGSEIADEIRSGTFDWKRAVVINELLKQQHFR